MSSDIEIAWAAGFFEGEGCITTFGNKNYAPKLTLCNTDLEVLRKFHHIVGGGVIRDRKTPTGSKQAWRWECYRIAEVYEVIGKLLPYLGSRRKSRWEELDQRRKSFAGRRIK